jgi:ATP-dependent helicase YprA (DUF1998 family)
MDDAFAMQMIHCIDQRLHYSRHIFLIAANFSHQLASFHILHQKKDVVVITEVGVKFDHVGVV